MESSKFSKATHKSHPDLDDPNYFRLPHPAFYTFTISLVTYVMIMAVAPDKLPACLGPLSRVGQYLASHHPNFTFGLGCVVVVLHCLEAAYAAKVCQDRRYTRPTTLKWSLSALVIGFPVMIRLLSHKPGLKDA